MDLGWDGGQGGGHLSPELSIISMVTHKYVVSFPGHTSRREYQLCQGLLSSQMKQLFFQGYRAGAEGLWGFPVGSWSYAGT